MRSGQDSPVLINRALREQELIKSIAVGGSFLLAITDSGKLYGMGENYKVHHLTTDSGSIGAWRYAVQDAVRASASAQPGSTSRCASRFPAQFSADRYSLILGKRVDGSTRAGELTTASSSQAKAFSWTSTHA
jgi:hypothetical protein